MRALTIASLLIAAVAPSWMSGADAALNAADVAAPPALRGSAQLSGYSPSVAMGALYYSKAAYCDASTIASWNCAACGYHSGMTNIKVAQYDDLQAYMAYNTVENRIIVAFRGSANIPNWISDLSFTKIAYPPCNGGCDVHHGFYDVWTGISSQVTPVVQSLVNSYPGAQVFVTGHSLGAAVSILAALDITTATGTNNLMLYNFGEPRVGDANFAKYAASTLPAGQQFRVTHHEDPVPHLPPKDFGFLHTPHEIFYDNNGNTTYVSCSDSVTAEDEKCSDQFPIPDVITDHLLYLGVSTHCAPN